MSLKAKRKVVSSIPPMDGAYGLVDKVIAKR